MKAPTTQRQMGAPTKHPMKARTKRLAGLVATGGAVSALIAAWLLLPRTASEPSPRAGAEAEVVEAGPSVGTHTHEAAPLPPRRAPEPEDATGSPPAVASLEAAPPMQTSSAERRGDGKQTREGELRRAAARWSSTGLCDAEEAEARARARSALLATFERLELPEGVLLHAREVDPAARMTVRASLANALRIMMTLVGWPENGPAPTVILYRSLDEMLSVSCVNRSAFGYYDGAIHVSAHPKLGLAALGQTVEHEYVHHVLVTMGVRLPMWLSEGLALYVAREQWWRDPSLGLSRWLASTHIPFEELVPAFPHTADERYAGAAYFQSLMMVLFLVERQGMTVLKPLVEALASGQRHPDEAFSAAAMLEGSRLETEWRAWLDLQLNPRPPVNE